MRHQHRFAVLPAAIVVVTAMSLVGCVARAEDDMGEDHRAQLGPTCGETALSYAEAQLGKPYALNGAGPNTFDCSGLTMMAWQSAGVSLPHSAAEQYRQTPMVSQLAPGDLLFYGADAGEVAIYAGANQVIYVPEHGTVVKVAASSPGALLGGGRPACP